MILMKHRLKHKKNISISAESLSFPAVAVFPVSFINYESLPFWKTFFYVLKPFTFDVGGIRRDQFC